MTTTLTLTVAATVAEESTLAAAATQAADRREGPAKLGLGSQLLFGPLVNVDLTVCSVENSAAPLIPPHILYLETPRSVVTALLPRARTCRLQTAIEPSFCADVIVCPGRRSKVSL